MVFLLSRADAEAFTAASLQTKVVALLEFHRPLELLRSRPVFSASGREAVEAELRRSFAVDQVEFLAGDEAVYAQSGKVALRDAGLLFCAYDAPTQIRFPAMEGYRQVLCLAGKGRIRTRRSSVDVTPEVSCIIPPETPFMAEYGAGYRHLILQFDPINMSQKIEAITGLRPSEPLNLPTMTPLSTERQWRLKSLALTLAGQFAEDIPTGDLAVAELSQALATMFLQVNLDGFGEVSSARESACGRHEASLLEDYIDAHWNEPLAIEDIAQACGVSVRSVYARFKQHRGMSPASYLRDVRLSNAHSLLLAPTGGSVIDVALKCGFASFGHFARRYREKFGELPSTTLARRTMR
jgi:AraC-like DNA-binding protein